MASLGWLCHAFDSRADPLFATIAPEKHDSLECQGYIREDAARIALNVVLYSLQQ